MKLATWNVNSLAVRLPQVLGWLSDNADTDVLALQELKMTDDKFPHQDFAQLGYQCLVYGQKTYNGVALVVKNGLSIANIQRNNPHFADEQARLISAEIAGVYVVGAYFPNGQAPESEKFAYKIRWLDALREWLQAQLAQNSQLVLMGDFNIAPEDEDTHDPVLLHETIHHTSQERQELAALQALGLHDAFRLFPQAPKSYSWWDYRELAFRRNKGLRIDLILVSDALKAQVRSCTIDKQVRKNERPSDHAPVIMDLAL